MLLGIARLFRYLNKSILNLVVPKYSDSFLFNFSNKP